MFLASLALMFLAAADAGVPVAPADGRLPPARVEGLPAASSLGWAHSTMCAVVEGEVWCWGRCDQGLCGPKGRVAQDTRLKLPGLAGIEKVSLFGDVGCALHKDQGVSCWGGTRFSKGVGAEGPGPFRIAGLKGVTRLLASRSSARCSSRAPRSVEEAVGSWNAGCERTRDQQVWCWGVNDFAQLARPVVPSALSKDVLERAAH